MDKEQIRTSWRSAYRGGGQAKGQLPLVGLTLRDLANTERTFHVAAIKRGWDLIIPRGSDTLLEGDTIYLVATPENLNTLPALCGTVQKRIRRVMIAGGDKFARIVAARLMKDYGVVIIEPDRGYAGKSRRFCQT